MQKEREKINIQDSVARYEEPNVYHPAFPMFVPAT